MVALIYMMIIISSGQVFYHFGTSFGQIYKDKMYSSNRVAVSGNSSSQDNFDVISTDRGAYLPDHSSGISLYPNDVTSDYILIKGEFSSAFWYMMIPESDGLLLKGI